MEKADNHDEAPHTAPVPPPTLKETIYNFLMAMWKGGSLDDVQTQVAIRRFALDFEDQYGPHPAFFEDEFIAAIAKAKREYKLLLVYLHSDLHQNSAQFARQTLGSPAVISFINDNVVFWANNVSHSSGYFIANALQSSTYPFMAVVCPISNRAIQRIEGPVSPEELIGAITRMMEQQEGLFVTTRLDEEERTRSALLREEQDREYELALEADRQKEYERQLVQAEQERQRQAAEEEKQRIEREAQEYEQFRASQLACKRERLRPEPQPGTPGTATVAIRLPNGERLTRRFLPETPVQAIYDFVDLQETALPINAYLLASNFPLRVLSEPDMTIQEAGLAPQALLFVQHTTST